MRRRQRAANEKGKNMTAEIMDAAKAGMEKALSNLNEAFVNVRTGRANPMVLDKIRVDYYGVPTPINQMAAVKSPDAHMLVVEPWDKSVLRGIEAAILASDLGITPSNDGSVIRLPFPALTEERRKEFVANVSHELRTPLTNVRSYAETIREAGDDLSRETENDFLDVVISETDRMTHIVQDLLTLSRLDSGRSEMNMARFPFSAAIDSVLRSTELEARRHKHELTHDYTENLPLIMGDRGRIEQVMLNVLSNAVKYTPDGGHIRVTAGSEGETVWMEVADDGIGIPEADRSRIFERFYRVDKARSRESGGTGLGLSIATEIVQRHHGSLTLVDRPGPGTTVRLELPITQPIGGEDSHE